MIESGLTCSSEKNRSGNMNFSWFATAVYTFDVRFAVLLPFTSIAFCFALTTTWFGPSQIQLIPPQVRGRGLRNDVEHLGTRC